MNTDQNNTINLSDNRNKLLFISDLNTLSDTQYNRCMQICNLIQRKLNASLYVSKILNSNYGSTFIVEIYKYNDECKMTNYVNSISFNYSDIQKYGSLGMSDDEIVNEILKYLGDEF